MVFGRLVVNRGAFWALRDMILRGKGNLIWLLCSWVMAKRRQSLAATGATWDYKLKKLWKIMTLYLQDLDGARSGTMAGTHVSVGLGDGIGGVGGSVLTVHVVRAGSWVVSEPDAEVLDNGGGGLGDLLDGDDLAGGLVDLLVVRDKVPESGLGRDRVRGEETHTVKWWRGLGSCSRGLTNLGQPVSRPVGPQTRWPGYWLKRTSAVSAQINLRDVPNPFLMATCGQWQWIHGDRPCTSFLPISKKNQTLLTKKVKILVKNYQKSKKQRF